MLRYQVRGENLEITQAIREYIENKVSKLEKYFADSLEANVYANAKVYKNNKKKKTIRIVWKEVQHLTLHDHWPSSPTWSFFSFCNFRSKLCDGGVF